MSTVVDIKNKQLCAYPDCTVPISQPEMPIYEDVIAAHYRSEHNQSIYNKCMECDELFIALIDPVHETYRAVCYDCSEGNPLKDLLVDVEARGIGEDVQTFSVELEIKAESIEHISYDLEDMFRASDEFSLSNIKTIEKKGDA